MPKPGQSNRRKSSLPKLIDKYYADLADLARQNVLFEMGLRQPFHALLAAAGKEHGWTLIAEQEKKVGGKTIRPDGTFKDEMNLVRGYWEAKDTADKLDVEIEKKRKAGYPLNNIIFEDTATANHLYTARNEWSRRRRSVDFYDEGALIWLDTDTLIREKTKGTKMVGRGNAK